MEDNKPTPAPEIATPSSTPLRERNRQPKSHRRKVVLIACAVLVLGMGGLAIKGGTAGPGSTTNPYNAPYAQTSPTPIPALTHTTPELGTISTTIAVDSQDGGPGWIDVAVTVQNNGSAPVAGTSVSLVQDGVPLTITDGGGWSGTATGVTLPDSLGIGSKAPVVLRVEQWNKRGGPIKIVLSGNGVANDPTIPVASCGIDTPGADNLCH